MRPSPIPGLSLLIALVVLVSGCIGTIDTGIGEDTAPNSLALVNVGQNGSGMPSGPVEISVGTVFADKGVYHSAETLNLSAVILSSSYAGNAVVRATGIYGRMNMEKTVNLTLGENLVSFAYVLPRCNVCGGIAAGTYSLACEVSYENATASNSTSVQILQ